MSGTSSWTIFPSSSMPAASYHWPHSHSPRSQPSLADPCNDAADPSSEARLLVPVKDVPLRRALSDHPVQGIQSIIKTLQDAFVLAERDRSPGRLVSLANDLPVLPPVPTTQASSKFSIS
ncbi:hypothetical protein AGABI1DRAFT_132521 [Agaricus bisporus var. burnettii JB137-S8]|uniref:Uncharacterized protein n=1 Tax=Agaricus bisporus var. burnettii (strain JB137-S8 / ATCC MYA-4627 / FGSC 10392) TaxID=597362 RepID=K5VLB5_AGABU|nr:uncharacterized protein AGABI1DRAFT_132521 [Agaricus bisporus var. burnettii JB137-S8]EKM75169.1 hypothetical protein AGABI1DRAFT_132521 [Agaricus bisporus var. burnettii JB137-S8]